MILTILELVGAVVAWTFLWPIAEEASKSGHTLKAIVFGVLAFAAGFYGIVAGLALFAGIIGSLWSILLTLGFLFLVIVVVKLIREKLGK